jgi:DNA-binding NtrC family response regulator
MPRTLQVKLLSVLQRREIQRLGGERKLKVDVRIMAATNRDLQQDVKEGRFREDLFYRLNVMPLEIPPLRKRREDITDLVGRIINFFRSSTDKHHIAGMTEESLQSLLNYDFPGNVRELINVIERAMLLCRGNKITLSDLPEQIRGTGNDTRTEQAKTHEKACAWIPDGAQPLPEAWLDRPLGEARRVLFATFEKAYLRGLLQKTKGVVGDTAKLAGITSRSLYDKMKRHGLKKSDFRD